MARGFPIPVGSRANFGLGGLGDPLGDTDKVERLIQNYRDASIKGLAIPRSALTEIQREAQQRALEALRANAEQQVQQQLGRITDLEQQFPGRAAGGTGPTGLGRHDRAGFLQLENARRAKQTLLGFLGEPTQPQQSVSQSQIFNPQAERIRRRREGLS